MKKLFGLILFFILFIPISSETQTVTKGLIGKEDFNIQINTNDSETFSRRTSTGGTTTLNKMPDIWDGTGKINIGDIYTKGPWIDARAYATIELANTGAYNAGKLLLISSNWTLTANTTFTAAVMRIPGGSFTKASTYTLTFSGSFENPSNGQCFIGFSAGDVTFADGTIDFARHEWWGKADFGLSLQSAINSTSKVVIGPGTHTFTVAHYLPGDTTHLVGVYLKDNSHIVIEKGATVTQANNLNLEVFFAGHLWGTDAGVCLDNVTIEVNGMIDGNYTNQSYTSSTNSEACPIHLFAKNSNFPLIRAQNYGRYGALVVYYGPHLNIGHIFAQNSYDSLYKEATALHLETSVQTNITSIIADSLQGFAVSIDSGATALNIGSINAEDCGGALTMFPGQFLGLNDINIVSLVSTGNAGVGLSSSGLYIQVYDSPYYPVKDITFGQVNISNAYLSGVEICAATVTQVASRIQFGSLLLRNNGQAGGGTGSGFVIRSSDNVKIGSLIAYDDQTPKTQTWGILMGDAFVTHFTIGAGDVTGNSSGTVGNYDSTKHHLLDVIGFITENSGISAAIASGATIAHGLVAAPTFVSVGTMDTGLSNLYWTADATNITVNYTGGGTHTFYWYARTARSN